METNNLNKDAWYRNCPSCGNQIIYSSLFTCESSYNVNPLCYECSRPKKPGGQPKKKIKKPRGKIQIICEDNDNFLAMTTSGWIRRCPRCNDRVYHTKENNARTAIKVKRICSKCRSKDRYEKEGPPKGFDFTGKTHTEKTIQRQCEYRKGWWNDVKNADEFIRKNNSNCICYKLDDTKSKIP